MTAGCCSEPDHAPNRSGPNFRSSLINGLERTKKNIKRMTEKAGIACNVVNPLWLLAGPQKLPEAEIIKMIEAGWGTEPVHPSAATYEKLAAALLDVLRPSSVPDVSGPPGRLLATEVPEWQRPQAALRGKRAAQPSRGGAYKYQKRF